MHHNPHTLTEMNVAHTLSSTPSQTNNSVLIGSLVRLPENYLHIQESERVLKGKDKYRELIDLYFSKKFHKKGKHLESS